VRPEKKFDILKMEPKREDDDQEAIRRIYAAWDKLPMPPPEVIERFEQSAHRYNTWCRQFDPAGRIKPISEEDFNEMSMEERVYFLVNVFKIWHRDPYPN
jgi:hypothetical protein